MTDGPSEPSVGAARHRRAAHHEPTLLAELVGTVLEQRYELGRILGAGGMGAVFEAKDRLLGRPVAVKVMRPGFAQRDDYIKRFIREAQAASKIRHRNVVVILDYGEAEAGLIYSVMEFLVGQDLEHMLRERPGERLSWPEARGLLIQIASGLNAVHARGVIHRDVKPANCVLTEEDGEPVVKVVDFGIAKLDDAGQSQQITGTAQVLGTPSYMAPELFGAEGPPGPRSDVYSLGVVAYRMLAGRVPFTGSSVFEVMGRVCMCPVPSLRKQVPDVPRAVESLVLQMLAKKPEGRPADMLAVRQRLQELTLEPSWKQRVRRPALAGVLVTALLGGWVYSSLGPDEDGGALEAERGDVAAGVSEQAAADLTMPEAIAHVPTRADDGASAEPIAVPPGPDPAVAASASVPPAGAPPPAHGDEDGIDDATPSTKAKASPRRPAGPPSDAVLEQKLRRKIASECVDGKPGERVTVSFLVTASGEISLLTASPKEAVGQCAKRQVEGTRFRPRTGDGTPVKIVVE
jgi:hypothetical protein